MNPVDLVAASQKRYTVVLDNVRNAQQRGRINQLQQINAQNGRHIAKLKQEIQKTESQINVHQIKINCYQCKIDQHKSPESQQVEAIKQSTLEKCVELNAKYSQLRLKMVDASIKNPQCIEEYNLKIATANTVIIKLQNEICSIKEKTTSTQNEAVRDSLEKQLILFREMENSFSVSLENVRKQCEELKSKSKISDHNYESLLQNNNKMKEMRHNNENENTIQEMLENIEKQQNSFKKKEENLIKLTVVLKELESEKRKKEIYLAETQEELQWNLRMRDAQASIQQTRSKLHQRREQILQAEALMEKKKQCAERLQQKEDHLQELLALLNSQQNFEVPPQDIENTQSLIEKDRIMFAQKKTKLDKNIMVLKAKIIRTNNYMKSYKNFKESLTSRYARLQSPKSCFKSPSRISVNRKVSFNENVREKIITDESESQTSAQTQKEK